MTQILHLKTDKSTGAQRQATVIRSWQDARGEQIYLHANGVYGYKDGSPVQSDNEFGLIGDPLQKKMALRWWNQAGKEMSETFYAKKQEELEARQEKEVPVVDGDSSALDAALYRRRKGKAAFGNACTWPEWFAVRPEWWGHAGLIEINGYRYEQIAMDADEEMDAVEPKSAAQAGAY